MFNKNYVLLGIVNTYFVGLMRKGTSIWITPSLVLKCLAKTQYVAALLLYLFLQERGLSRKGLNITAKFRLN